MNKAPVIALISLLTCLVTSSTAWALSFDQTEATLSLGYTQNFADVVFKYTNTSSEPVTIKSIAPNCGCTQATVNSDVLRPRAAGALVASIDLSSAATVSDVTISLQASDKVEPYILTVHLKRPSIPVRADSPRLLVWRIGEKPTPKRVKLYISPELIANVTKINSNNSNFRAKIDEESPGVYWVEVEPIDTHLKSGARITFPDAVIKRYEDWYRIYAYLL